MYRLSEFSYIFKKKNKVFFYNPLKQKKLLCNQEFYNKISQKLLRIEISEEEMNEELRILYKYGFIIDRENNNEMEILEKIRTITPPNRQELWFHLTEICTGNCSYCRQRVSKVPQKESLKINDALDALELFLKQADISRTINIVFYGGEPFLNFKTIKAVVETITKKKQNNKKLKVEYNVFTNGQYINDEIIQFIKKYNIKVIFSVDGPKEINDIFRKTPEGKGMYKKLRHSYQKFKENGITPGLSLVVTLANSKILLDVIKTLQNDFKPLNIYPNIMHNTAKDESFICERYSARKILEAYDEMSKQGFQIENVQRKVRTFVENKIRLAECGACGNRLVIFPDGKIGPCEGTLHLKELRIDRLDDFNLSECFEQWRKRTPFNIDACLKCPAIGICGGGCPLDPLEQYGNMYELDKRFCDFALECLWYFIDRIFEDCALDGYYKVLERDDIKFLYGKILEDQDLPFRTGAFYGEIPVENLED
ncbi:MAG: radical SAM protein [Candidatus Heimdallarchaeaceae archaeon]